MIEINIPLPETHLILSHPYRRTHFSNEIDQRHTMTENTARLTFDDIDDPRIMEKLIFAVRGFHMDPLLLRSESITLNGENGTHHDVNNLYQHLLEYVAPGQDWDIGVRLHRKETNDTKKTKVRYPMAYFHTEDELRDMIVIDSTEGKCIGWKDVEGELIKPEPGDKVYIFPIPNAPEQTFESGLENQTKPEKTSLNGGFRIQLNHLEKNEQGLFAELTFALNFGGHGPRSQEEESTEIPHTSIVLTLPVDKKQGFILPPADPTDVESTKSNDAQVIARQVLFRFLDINPKTSWRLLYDLFKMRPIDNTVSIEGMWAYPKRDNVNCQYLVSPIGFDGPNTWEKFGKLSDPLPPTDRLRQVYYVKNEIIPNSAKRKILITQAGEDNYQHRVAKSLRTLNQLLPVREVKIIQAHFQKHKEWAKDLTAYAALGRLLERLYPQKDQAELLRHISSFNLTDIQTYRIATGKGADELLENVPIKIRFSHLGKQTIENNKAKITALLNDPALEFIPQVIFNSLRDGD